MLCSSPWWVRPDRRYASTIISRNPCQESAMKLDSKRGREIALVVLLAIAANMPAEVAENLGISTLPLLIAMATMVGFSVINYVVDLLPTGLEKKPREQSAEGIKVLFYAIEKGNLIYAQKILS